MTDAEFVRSIEVRLAKLEPKQDLLLNYHDAHRLGVLSGFMKFHYGGYVQMTEKQSLLRIEAARRTLVQRVYTALSDKEKS